MLEREIKRLKAEIEVGCNIIRLFFYFEVWNASFIFQMF